MTVAEWEAVFKRQKWGAWPEIRFVEWFMRTFGAASSREREIIRVLELGCGAGAQLKFLQGEGFQAFGVDGSRAALQQAKRNLAMSYGFGPNVHLIEADLQRFEPPQAWGRPELSVSFDSPVSDVVERPDMGFFDCIVDICTLQHMAGPPAAQVVQRCRRWLKPGGYLFSKHAAHRRDRPVGRPPSDVPEPYLLPFSEIEHLYPILERKVAEEILTIDLDAETVELRHWIIIGRKV